MKTTKENLGNYMYDFLEEHNFPRDKSEEKLTQLLSTHNQFMSLGMYELWGLIDDFHFIVDEISIVITFTKHNKIGKFVNKLFNMKVSAKT
jgi:hypothetical protein